MLVSNPMKFHHDILNGFQVTERTQHHDILNDFQVTEQTRLECKFCFFPFQRAITQKICNPELRFLCSARRLMLLIFL